MGPLGGLVTLVNCALAAVVGVRLLRLGARSGGPERWLGVYFLGSQTVGTVLAGVIYMSWADPSLTLPDAWRAPLFALWHLAANLGLFGVYAFTWRTFRPEARWARRTVAAGGAVLLLTTAVTGAREHFAVHVLNGPSYWVGFLARQGALVWMAIESLRYWGLLRRRLRLGLADALVANRFALWSLWAVIAVAMGASDPIGRLWYYLLTGTTRDFLPDVGRPIVVAMMALTSAFGIAAAASLVLTFFPTPAYRRWVECRPLARDRAAR